MKISATLAYVLYAATVALGAPVEKRASASTYTGGTTASDVENGGQSYQEYI